MSDGLTFGSLFAGIGGIDLGLEAHGLRPVWHSEIEPTSSAVLAEHWPGIPNHGDITAIDWRKVEPVDVIAGGFPCQDISFAGRGAGLSGEKSGLWVEMAGAVRALRPRFVFVENVGGLRRRGLGTVLGDLAALGYDVTWSCLRASDVGAPHRRERLFIVASNADDERRERGREKGLFAPFAKGRERGITGTSEVSQDAHVEPGYERGLPTPDEAQGRRPRPEFARRGGTPTADATSEGRPWRSLPVDEGPTHGQSRDETCSTTPDAGSPRRRQDSRGPFGNESEDGRGHKEANNVIVRPGSGQVPSSVAPDPDVDGRQELERVQPGLGPRRDTDGRGASNWGDYAPAIERWERLTRPAPGAVDEKGRLAAPFVEWLMGFPDGWTLAAGSRPARLRALGNAVVPHCAARAWAVLAPEIVAAQAEYEASA